MWQNIKRKKDIVRTNSWEYTFKSKKVNIDNVVFNYAKKAWHGPIPREVEIQACPSKYMAPEAPKTFLEKITNYWQCCPFEVGKD